MGTDFLKVEVECYDGVLWPLANCPEKNWIQIAQLPSVAIEHNNIEKWTDI